MAVYNLENYTEKDGLGFPLNFRRGNPNPLDNSSVYKSFEDAQAYATSDPVAYVGQIISVVDNTKGIVTIYSIQNTAGTLKEVGSMSISGDNKTVAVSDTGEVSLVGIADIEDTTKNYQPVLVNGVLTWQELSSTTVEGLDASIKALNGEVDDLQEGIGALDQKVGVLEKTVGNSESGLIKTIATISTKANTNETNIGALTTRVDTAETDIDEIQSAIANVYNKSETANLIAEEIGKQIHFNKQVVTDLAEMTKDNVLYLVKDTNATGTDVYKEYLIIDGVPVVIGDTSTDLSGYIKTETFNTEIAKKANASDLQALQTAVDGKASASELSALATRIENHDRAFAGKANVSDLEALQTTVGEQATAIQGLTTSLESKANASDLEALQTTVGEHGTDIEALKAVGAEKNVINSIDEAYFAIDSNRKLTLNDISMDKVSGLNALAEKVNGIEAGAEVNDIVAITLGGSETALPIVDKKVDIPVATTESLGVVLSSTEENAVSVAADGTMKVNKINVNNIVQSENDTLILNGGSAVR